MDVMRRDPDENEGWQTVGSGMSREAQDATLIAWRDAERECKALRERLRGAVDHSIGEYLDQLVASSRAICELEGVENVAEWIGKTVLARVGGQ